VKAILEESEKTSAGDGTGGEKMGREGSAIVQRKIGSLGGEGG